MNMATKINPSVEEMIKDLKENPSVRFSKTDFQALVYAVLADKNFKAKKYVLKNDELIAEDDDLNGAMGKFMDKLLKHAGMSDASERAKVIDTFEFGVRDVEWVSDAVDEAMYQYVECGKNMRMFRNKMMLLSIRKMERSGKYAGTMTFRKTIVDRQLALTKKKAKK